MTYRVAEFRTVSVNGRVYHGGDLVVLTPDVAKAIENTGALEPTADDKHHDSKAKK